MKTIINIKTDKEVKKNAQKLAEELGLSLSAVINAQLKQFIRNKSINLSSIPQMSKDLENLLGKVEKDLKTKKNISGPFRSAKEAINHLDNHNNLYR